MRKNRKRKNSVTGIIPKTIRADNRRMVFLSSKRLRRVHDVGVLFAV